MRRGFTLIELSIVLVIIGLLIGGTVVGRALIFAAEIRSSVRQIEQLQTAINSFKVKYGCLPGDCSTADSFGLTHDEGAELAGNGDGRIYYYAMEASGVNRSESALALIHLREAQLVSGIKGESSATRMPLQIRTTNPYCNTASALSITYQAGDWVGGHASNYFMIAGDGGNDCPVILPPMIAYSIDAKVDDGLPRSGKAVATGGNGCECSDSTGSNWASPPLSSGGPAGAASPYCFTNDATPQYNIENATQYQEHDGDGPLCVLGIRTSF